MAKKNDIYQRAGWSGTPQMMGFINKGNEVDQNFPRIAAYMIRVDASVRTAVQAKDQALLSVDWAWESSRPGDPEADALADFANVVWDSMDESWESALAGGLSKYTDYGFAYSEIVYTPPTTEFPYIGLKSLAHCEQTAHYRWLIAPDGRTLEGVEQLPNIGYSNSTGSVIPKDKLFVLTFGKEGSDFNGLGLLRSCFEDFEEKHHARDLRKIAAERWALPIPVIKSDLAAAQAAGITQAQHAENVRLAQQSAEDMIADRQSWLSASEGVTIEKWNLDTFNPAALDSVINSCDENIARLYLVQWILFSGAGGSLAMAEALIKEFNKSLTNILEYIAGQARDQIISRLVNLNFGDVSREKLPYLKFTEVIADPLTNLVMSAGLSTLISTGVVEVDESLKNSVRFTLGLPEIDSVPEGEVIAEGLETEPAIEDTEAEPTGE